MRSCDFCKEEIPAMYAGRQLGGLFMHQKCYDSIADRMTDILLKELPEAIMREKIELKAGEIGPLGEIIQPIA